MEKLKCKLCGKEYTGCRRCNEKNTQVWKSVSDTKEHYQIYQYLVWYARGIVNKEQAKEALSKCDLSKIDTFTDENKSLLTEILGDESTVDELPEAEEIIAPEADKSNLYVSKKRRK